MVTNDTQPITTNIREMNSLFLLTESTSGSANTCNKKAERAFFSAEAATFDRMNMSSHGQRDGPTVMILEKRMAKTGCMAPLIVAQMVPTRM